MFINLQLLVYLLEELYAESSKQYGKTSQTLYIVNISKFIRL